MKLTKAQLFILIRLIVDLYYSKGEEHNGTDKEGE